MNPPVRSVVPLILRRMRAPLILVIVTLSIATVGFTLIPGQDAVGRPWHMGFFHAFYFVSFMATTIGFGEVPYTFTDAQRMWTIFTIYLTVTAWVYALGSMIALIQDPAFRQTLARSRFRRAVRRLREPFYLICGYGDTGAELARALTERGRRVVVIDIQPDRINQLLIASLPLFAPALCGDANLTDNLLAAGLKHDCCLGVVAVTNDDQANLQVAISVKLLRPSVLAICRAETRETMANMKSFGTDHVVNPFEAFAVNLVTAMRSPDLQRIEEWLTALPGGPLTEPAAPPRGHWIICGFGRAGRALQRHLGYQGVTTSLIDPALIADAETPPIRGKGTEAVTLREARVEEAAAIFAATGVDADNLSISVTARELNPGIFVAARQNNRWADPVFEAAALPLVMTPSRIIATEVLSVLAAPLLGEFLRFSRHQRPEWAQEFAERLRQVSEGRIPAVWTLTVDATETPALVDALLCGRALTVGTLAVDPRCRDDPLPCMSLLLRRGEKQIELPAAEQPLAIGDRLLMCGRDGIRAQLNRTLRNHNALRYVETGEQRPDGWLWRHLHARQIGRGKAEG